MHYPLPSHRTLRCLSVFFIVGALALGWSLSRSGAPRVEAQGQQNANYKNYEAPQIADFAQLMRCLNEAEVPQVE